MDMVWKLLETLLCVYWCSKISKYVNLRPAPYVDFFRVLVNLVWWIRHCKQSFQSQETHSLYIHLILVGKTSLIARFMSDHFGEAYQVRKSTHNSSEEAKSYFNNVHYHKMISQYLFKELNISIYLKMSEKWYFQVQNNQEDIIWRFLKTSLPLSSLILVNPLSGSSWFHLSWY